MHACCYSIYIAPAPSVMVRTGGRADGIILADDTIVIFCDIQLNGVLRGSDVAVDVSWFNGSTKLANSTRVILQGLTGDATDVQSIVILGPVQLSDVGTYECRVILTPLLVVLPLHLASSTFLLNRPLQKINVSSRNHNLYITCVLHNSGLYGTVGYSHRCVCAFRCNGFLAIVYNG